MMRTFYIRAATTVSTALLLTTLFVLVFPVFPSQTTGNTIYIRSDGTVDPPTAHIHRVAGIYTLTSNINESIVIERDNIVVDGAGYVLQGDNAIGLSLLHRTNVTAKNLRIIGFLLGIKLEYSKNSVVSYNTITNNGHYGIWLQHSDDNTILGNVIANTNYGIYLEASSNNTLSNNIATNNAYCAICLEYSANNTLSRNTVQYSESGFVTRYSNHNKFADNTATNNSAYGFKLYHSNGTILSHNTAKINGEYGFHLASSVNCTLSGNIMAHNRFNFGVEGTSDCDFENDVEFLTNIADGKPIYYFKNVVNMVFDSSTVAATLYFINSRNITIKDLNLTKNLHGIFLWNTNNSRIENVMAFNNCYGMVLHNCFAEQEILDYFPENPDCFGVFRSTAKDNSYGIYMTNCDNHIVAENIAKNNTVDGIRLVSSDNNLIVDNKAINNINGFVIDGCNLNWIATWWQDSISIAANNTDYGFYIANSNDNWICWSTAINNGNNGFQLSASDNNEVLGNIATNNYGGIRLDGSRNNTISGNAALNNSGFAGIFLSSCPNSTISDNEAMNNSIGIGLGNCEGSVVFGNIMAGNKYNFRVFSSGWPPTSSGFDITVDVTNSADGKLIYFVKDSSNIVFDSATNAAAIYVINSTNITIRDLVINNNDHGVYFWNTNNSKIENVTAKYSYWSGIQLEYSSNVTILDCTLTNNIWHGLSLKNSGNITVCGSTITNNAKWGIMLHYGSSSNFLSDNIVMNNGNGFYLDAGIYLVGTSDNFLFGNTIADNLPNGIVLTSNSVNNTFFHNNMINNQIYATGAAAWEWVWDNGAEGNYWSGYTGNDLNGDGIGDTPHRIGEHNQDEYPLIGPWDTLRIFNITWGAKTYEVCTKSSSVIAGISFDQANRKISFITTGPNGAIGFCNVTIPKELLDAPLNQWDVSVNSEIVVPNVIENMTHTFIHFMFAHSTKTVNIHGTNPIDRTLPVADAGPDQSINEDTIVTFNGSASIDNIGIISYVWTFVDESPKTLIGIFQTYVFANPGLYTISLNVTDFRGNWGTDTLMINVIDITPPIADAGPSQTVDEGTSVILNASDSRDNVGPTNYTWMFTDVAPQILYGENTIHKFQNPGNYTITLNVTDAEGNWDTDTMTLIVLAIPVPIWTQWWFMAVLFVPMSSGMSYLIFRYRRRERLFEQLHKLVRQRVRDIITEDHYQEKLKELRETSDINTRERIKEYLPHIIAFERGIMFVDREKKKE